jgi:hypothetical protein
VENFGGLSNDTLKKAAAENKSASGTAYALGAGAVSRADFWLLPKADGTVGGGEVETLLSPVGTLVSGISLNQDKLLAWKDTLRIYVEQISSDTAWRSTTINMSMQRVQETTSITSNLLGAVEKLKSDAVGNVR